MSIQPSLIHHRRSLRLKGWDYTRPGAYFITIVSHHRQEIFGQVLNEQMKLSPLGCIVRDEWLRSITIRKEICLHDDEFVVMPNHMHAIVWMRSLSAFLSGFKASVTGRARRELNLTDIWQRNFYDHIARNEAEIKGFWDYIDDNPRKWEEDQLHPSAPPNKFNQE